MRLGGHTWQSRYKAATGVGRVRLQALSEINHPCWPLLAFLLSPHLSLCFPELVCLSDSPPLPLADGLRLSFEHCTFHNWDSVPITLCSPLPSKRWSFSHFVPEWPWLQLRLRDFAHSSWFNQTQNVIVSWLSETLQLKLTLRQTECVTFIRSRHSPVILLLWIFAKPRGMFDWQIGGPLFCTPCHVNSAIIYTLKRNQSEQPQNVHTWVILPI